MNGSFPPPGYLGLLGQLYQFGWFRFLLAFTRKISLIVLLPVFAIAGLFVMGITDSGWLQQLLDFLTHHLETLQGYAYNCARTLPDMQRFINCFE